MLNEIGQTPTNLVDMLFGFVGQLSGKVAEEPGEFGNILNQLGFGATGLTGTEGDRVSGSIPLPVGAEVALAGVRQLVLPQTLLGKSAPASESIVESPAKGQPETIPSELTGFRAEVLAAKHGNDQSLYLKIIPAEADESALQSFSGEAKAGEEMVLPMRLRTVEQNGNRVTAEAELLTATGKEASIKLRLEVGGSGVRFNTPVFSGESKADGNTAVETGKTPQPNLPRLLQNLEVKSLIIEPYSENVRGSGNEALPRMVPVKADGFNKQPETQALRDFAALKNGMNAESSKVVPSVSEKGEPAGPENNPSRVSPEWKAFDQLTGNRAAMHHTGGETQAGGSSTGAAMPIGESAFMSESSTENTGMRFYNLDSKLEQLKQNPGQKIKVQLVPARLGKMELSIVSYRGSITVNLTVESAQAKSAVERNLNQLESRLSSAGIRVDNVSLQVNQSSRNASFSAYQQQYGHHQENPGGFDHRNARRQYQYRPGSQPFRSDQADFRHALVNCLA